MIETESQWYTRMCVWSAKGKKGKFMCCKGEDDWNEKLFIESEDKKLQKITKKCLQWHLKNPKKKNNVQTIKILKQNKRETTMEKTRHKAAKQKNELVTQMFCVD